MGTHATIKIKNSPIAIYVHYDGYNLSEECNFICKELKQAFGDCRVDDDPEYATFRMVAALLKFKPEYNGGNYGLCLSENKEEFNYTIFKTDDGDVDWECPELNR